MILSKTLLFILCISLFGGCVLADEKSDSGKVLMDADKTIQITVPTAWKEDRDLHDSAELQASYRVKELYIIVLSEAKEDFQEMTAQKHSEITRATLVSSLSQPQTSSPVAVTINDRPALQYEIRGFINNLSVIYLHTTVETEKNYHQILTWTLKSMYEKNKPVLQKVTESFKEVPAGS